MEITYGDIDIDVHGLLRLAVDLRNCCVHIIVDDPGAFDVPLPVRGRVCEIAHDDIPGLIGALQRAYDLSAPPNHNSGE